MYKIAKVSDEERSIICRNTAAKKGMSETVVEKDFWVCMTLDYLFHKCEWKEYFAFKGGTSLSKAYGLIERFSEDIDLILDWRLLGYGIYEPWENRSKTKQSIFNEEANERAAVFLREKFVPVFKKDMEDLLSREVHIYIDDDPQTVNFDYPCLFTESSILRTIRLEIGALAAWTPLQMTPVRSYVAEEYERIFEQPVTEILTTQAERSFWEKATILHHEAHRPDNSIIPKRYSQHYYDLFCIAKSSVKKKAYEKLDLLNRVVEFKAKVYPRGWARYEEAKPGTFCLVPPLHSMDALRNDYANMRAMIYGDYPSFDEIMECIKCIEEEINSL